ncbi:EF-hand domain-containing protein [Streptomyces sp. NPDC053367]|uniref:EF-hand domain-containing protein n=1 Tax=Streptomyces sp. NPDC053367 TaxID=3365700 RepID=UPI0037CD6489
MTTISPFLDRKLARRFRTYDSDGSGYLERSDFESAANRMSDEFGLAADDPARGRLVELCVGLWEHLLAVADSDGDGRITESEYKSAFSRGLLETEDSFDAGYMPFLDAIMAVADTDGDGRLTADDHVRWTGSLMNLPEADAREIHRRLDADGDGHVTTADLLAAIRAYYFDERPDSAGSWLLGPLDS